VATKSSVTKTDSKKDWTDYGKNLKLIKKIEIIGTVVWGAVNQKVENLMGKVRQSNTGNKKAHYLRRGGILGGKK